MAKTKTPKTSMSSFGAYKSSLFDHSTEEEPKSSEEPFEKQIVAPEPSIPVELPKFEPPKREARRQTGILKTFMVDPDTLTDLEDIRYEHRLQYKEILQMAVALLKKQLAKKK